MIYCKNGNQPRRLILSPHWDDFLISLSPVRFLGAIVVVPFPSEKSLPILKMFEKDGFGVFLTSSVREKSFRFLWPAITKVDNLSKACPYREKVEGFYRDLNETVLSRSEIDEIYIPAGFIHPWHFFAVALFARYLRRESKVFVYADRPYFEFLFERIDYSKQKGYHFFKLFWRKFGGSVKLFPWGGGEAVLLPFGTGFPLFEESFVQSIVKRVEGESFVLRKLGWSSELLLQLSSDQLRLVSEYNI